MNVQEIFKILGNYIKIEREQKKLTQFQLAKLIKTDRSWITHIEVGRKNISIKMLSRIAKGLGTTVNKLTSNL